MSDLEGEALPEGEESPPPGVRTMGIVRWALVALMAAAAGGAWLHARGTPGHAEAGATFRCPMHPAVLQATPGSCPVCGMDLVAAAALPARPADGAPSAAGAAAGRYWCPMHPEVASDDPEARCDACGGMRLLPREPAAPAGPGVPGLVPVDLGERAQLGGVRTARAERARLAPTLRLAGVVAVREDAVSLVAARVQGFVEEVRVRQTGERVARGQVLATLSSNDLLAAQRAYLATARATAGVPTTGAVYQASTVQRLEQLGVAAEDVARIAAAGEPLPVVPVRAPRAGVVARRPAIAGLAVEPGTELFRLADLSTVWVVADVYPRDQARVRAGQAASVQLPALPGETFPGTVRLLHPALDPERQAMQARIELPNPDGRLRPGAAAEVRLAVDAGEAVVVPVDAVADTGEVRYLFVAKGGGRFEPRLVRLGASDGERVQVLEGVAEGEEVATAAAFLVDSESRLRAAVEGFAPAAKP